MFKYAPLPVAISLVLAMSVETAHARAPVSLLLQAEGLPREFQEHFFDVPLAVRVMLDGQVLGEAMVVLSRDERVTLLDFTDTYQSAYTEQERDTWKALLQAGVGLGPCQEQCGELVAAHYSLANSELALLTSTIERGRVASTYHALPENGSTGLMLQNQLNLSGGQQQDLAGRWGLEAIASLGNWTQTFQGELSQLGGDDDRLRHSVHELHTQREWQEHFLRLGYFTPGSLGLSRQPRLFGDSPDTALGLMLGSSDSLTKDGAKSAVYPIYVTANRAATVEIYRNGSLINSQQVEPGLQALDTRPLPGGIYDIDVRLMEDGSETSRTQALVYKPSNWRNPDQRWRYNVFAGRESKLLSNWDNQADGGSTLGGAVNYLLHPRAVVGLSARQVREQNQLGGSLDLGVGERSNVYGTLYQAQGRGMGMDLQARHDYGSGNLYLSHNRSWLDNRHTWETLPGGLRVRQRNPYNGNVSQSALGVYHRLGGNDSLSARLSHSEGQVQGMGMDLGYMRSAWLLGKDSSWRLSVFDRPATVSSGLERNRGVDLSLNMALGEPRQRFTASVGSRTSRDGSNDRNASLGYHQDVEAGPVKSLSAGLQADTYGVGMTGSARFEAPLGNGELMVQRSSYNNALTGNLNLNNHLVVGAGALAFTGQHVGKEAGLIIDVESDIDGLELRADDFSGMGGVLRPGRNVLPISAYRDASVQFDFQGTHAPAASIQPARARYHLNKGGVAYQQVRVMKTVTVLGRLLDEQGLPLKGHHVINHASRGVTEVDGFFSMELSASTPTLEVLRNDQVLCQFALDLNSLETEGDLLMAGDLRCVDGATTGQLARS
ncbi:CS1-pili formation C-terminal domain-containing protein [Pseudomonas sp. HR96]|uniref:CS1-pili formation C-terminal domain-containing protein n=1 Tax=Pseudomonas sp. HR96 TaxID=1027966 RepID=UPI002A759583|nr:CS1-pili formation C-terminal domain-containing protein [Pseudomonas sp. HR96]WPO98211.1 CS1-pili formation C-terminal domain-containing protein [Pseudomonas sp. HR96]